MITIAYVQFPVDKACVCAGYREFLLAKTCNHATLLYKQRREKVNSVFKKQHVKMSACDCSTGSGHRLLLFYQSS